MYVDSLPLKSEVGVVRADPITGNPRYHLNTYLQFNVQHDGSHIVSVNASTLETQQVALDPSQINDVEFSYSVFWEQVNVPYMERAQYHAQVCVRSFAPMFFLLSFLLCPYISILLHD